MALHAAKSADASTRRRRASAVTSCGVVSGGSRSCDQFLVLRIRSSAGFPRSGKKAVRSNGLSRCLLRLKVMAPAAACGTHMGGCVLLAY